MAATRGGPPRWVGARVTVAMRGEQRGRMERLAELKGTTLSIEVRHAIDRYVTEHEGMDDELASAGRLAV